MNWADAEAAIRAAIETGWAAGTYADTVQLYFENDPVPDPLPRRFIAVTIEGTYAEKSIYGSAGKRSSVEGGIVFFHCFVAPIGDGKAVALGPVLAMTALLELTTIADQVKLEGGNPPDPGSPGDTALPNGQQPAGNYFRVSGSVPFILIGTV